MVVLVELSKTPQMVWTRAAACLGTMQNWKGRSLRLSERVVEREEKGGMIVEERVEDPNMTRRRRR